MKTIINFFKSVKLAIVLFLLIAVAFIIGTLIPQLRSEAEYAARYGQLSGMLIKLQFTKLYQSFWFLTLLILFTLNTITCTLTRLGQKLKKFLKPKIIQDERSLKTLKLNARFSRKGQIEKTISHLQRIFSSHRFRIREEKEKDRVYILGRKRTLGHFGSDFVHLGLLVILLGGIISGILGFRGNINISEGQTVAIPNADFALKLEQFETLYYENGRIKDWKSTLVVIEDGVPQTKKVIEVNHPLSFKGYVFYQSRYGWDWENSYFDITVKKNSDPAYQEIMTLKAGEDVLIGDSVYVTVLRFVPDFILDERRQVASRSRDPNNPAVLIDAKKGDELVFSGWIFANFPDFTSMHSEGESDFSFHFDRFHAAQYSGIQMTKDPGVNFVWIGCAFLMLGLIFAFYWPPREVRCILREESGRVEIFAGGIASKNRGAFQNEFDEIVKSLRSSK